MPQTQHPPIRAVLGSLVVIAVVIGGAAVAFAYTAGWFSPQRLTPEKFIAALAPPGGEVLGHRRNHAKGICFTGTFEANGAGSELSRARVFTQGQYPVVGRFSLGVADPNAADATVRVRAMAIRVSTPDGQEWRSAMIDVPFFPVSTPPIFHDLLITSSSKDPNAMPGFAAAHPQIGAFGAWAKTAPWTGSYAEQRYNGIHAFIFVDNSGAEHPLRWSFVPTAEPVFVSPEDLGKRGPNFLEPELRERVGKGPIRWSMVVTLADPGDPTNDPSKPWPADRRTVTVGTLTVQQVQADADGPCRDINFDPTVLPDGIKVSDDPFPPARSSVYARSYDRRTAESADYPRTATGAKP